MEVPCHAGDEIWKTADEGIIDRVYSALHLVEPIDRKDILQVAVYRMPFAYPMLEVGYESKVGELLGYLGQFANLHLIGRNAQFSYLYTHDLFDAAEKMVRSIAAQ